MQDARGVCLTIPMPGHPVGPTEVTGVREECRQMAELVEGHDVVFLGTDTRESRWLPTLLCSATNTVSGGGVWGGYGRFGIEGDGTGWDGVGWDVKGWVGMGMVSWR